MALIKTTPASPMILRVQTEMPGLVLQLPLKSIPAGKSCTVDWGDETPPEVFTSGGYKSHTYKAMGDYHIAISGKLSEFAYVPEDNFGMPLPGINKITEVLSWGSDLGLVSLARAFYYATALVSVPVNLPPTVTNISGMLSYCSSFNCVNVMKWDIKQITDLSFLFMGATQFNQNISKWDLRNVTTTKGMFASAHAFDQPIGSWNVGNVTNMAFMFHEARAFNSDIGKWNVSRVTDMRYMFNNELGTGIFNQNIDKWDVARVTDMSYMFRGQKGFTQSLSTWKTLSAQNFSHMFDGCCDKVSSLRLANWATGTVTDMSGMFRQSAFNDDIGTWDVGNVTDMSCMFQNCQFDQDIGQWNVTKVANMNSMFFGCSPFNRWIGAWNVSKVTDMGAMFKNALQFNKDISGWDVSNVTNMNSMFCDADSFNQDLSGWQVGKVTDMNSMFKFAMVFNQDISGWDVSNVSDMGNMFDNAQAFNKNLGNWKLRKAGVNLSGMYIAALALSDENFFKTVILWANYVAAAESGLPDSPRHVPFGTGGRNAKTSDKEYYPALPIKTYNAAKAYLDTGSPAWNFT